MPNTPCIAYVPTLRVFVLFFWVNAGIFHAWMVWMVWCPGIRIVPSDHLFLSGKRSRSASPPPAHDLRDVWLPPTTAICSQAVRTWTLLEMNQTNKWTPQKNGTNMNQHEPIKQMYSNMGVYVHCETPDRPNGLLYVGTPGRSPYLIHTHMLLVNLQLPRGHAGRIVGGSKRASGIQWSR